MEPESAEPKAVFVGECLDPLHMPVKDAGERLDAVALALPMPEGPRARRLANVGWERAEEINAAERIEVDDPTFVSLADQRQLMARGVKAIAGRKHQLFLASTRFDCGLDDESQACWRAVQHKGNVFM